MSTYSTTELEAALESLPPGVLAGIGVATLILCIISIIANWKIFTKAGEAGWKSLIPIYNLYIIVKIATGNGILFLLCLIPVVDVVFTVWYQIQLAKSFGKSVGFGVGLVFLPFIFLLILAFGDASYLGPKGQI